jgi:hypothetical protein
MSAATGVDPVVRWGAGPLAFELTSDDPAVHDVATAVFRPWRVESASPPTCAWWVDRIDAVGDDPHWRVRSSAGSEARASSVERAVSAVEFGAVGAILASPTATAHGALVVRDGRGVLLVGRGESGKSTLACALWQRGAALLGDDVALLDPAHGEARPAPRRVSVREESRPLLGERFFERIRRGASSASRGDGCLFHPDEIEPGPPRVPVPLAALVFLARRGAAAGPAGAEPLPSALALLALLPYTNLLTGRETGAAIRTLAPLVARIPAFDLGRGPLDVMAGAVEALVHARGESR